MRMEYRMAAEEKRQKLNVEQKKPVSKLRQHGQKAKQKGLSALFKLVFSHMMVTVVLLIAQIYLMYAVLYRVQSQAAFLALFYGLGMVAIVVLINGDDNPAFKLAWIIPICIFPVFGVALYIFISANPGGRHLHKRIDIRVDETRHLLKTEHRVVEKIKKEPSGFRNICHYLQQNNQMPTYDHTAVTFFSLGEEKYADLLMELKKAKSFIFLEYFIIHKGEVWDNILEILKEKAAEGVEVRLLYDGMNTLSALPTN